MYSISVAANRIAESAAAIPQLIVWFVITSYSIHYTKLYEMVSYFVAFYTNQTINWGMAAALV